MCFSSGNSEKGNERGLYYFLYPIYEMKYHSGSCVMRDQVPSVCLACTLCIFKQIDICTILEMKLHACRNTFAFSFHYRCQGKMTILILVFSVVMAFLIPVYLQFWCIVLLIETGIKHVFQQMYDWNKFHDIQNTALFIIGVCDFLCPHSWYVSAFLHSTIVAHSTGNWLVQLQMDVKMILIWHYSIKHLKMFLHVLKRHLIITHHLDDEWLYHTTGDTTHGRVREFTS